MNPTGQQPAEAGSRASVEVLSLLPAQGQWSESDYLWLTNRTRQLVELDNGTIEVLPMPNEKHQAIVGFLYRALLAVARQIGGKALFAPFRLRVRTGKFREPDLLLLMSAADARRHDTFWDGADLVVEVLSEDDPDRALVTKRAEYAAAGIAEYWIVDPARETVHVLSLQGNAYVEHGTFARGATVTSSLLPALAVAADALFDAE